MASNDQLQRNGDTLAVSGVLDRAAVTDLWPRALAQLAGARTLDLSGVQRLDSAGVAMLAELAARLRSNGNGTVVGKACLLYTSPSPRDRTRSRMPSSA